MMGELTPKKTVSTLYGVMGNKLKPCPFCGSHAELQTRRNKPGERTVIRCSNINCYMRYPSAFTSYHNGDSEEHAELRLATAWNRRVKDD